MGLTDRIANALGFARAQWPTISWQDYANLVTFNGHTYLTGALNQTIKGHAEEIGTGFDSLVQQAYQTNAIVFACELARISLFSEARFQFQRMRNGRPGDLYGTAALDIIEHPWKTAITGDLLTRVLLDADLGGTAFLTRRRSGIRRLRPDWVTMILGSENDPDVDAGDIDAEVIGLAYYPGGKNSGKPPEFLLRSEVAIFAPIPDPLATYRGMPWVMPVLREIVADKQMTDHKSSFLLNGATPNLTVAIDKDLKEAANPAAFAEWVAAFKKTNPSAGQWEKFSTWYLAGGTTVTKVGSTMQEIDFKQVQGAGETRIAAAAGVPPVIVGLSEGLQAATYSNYGQARRRFADNTMRPLWRNMAGSLETIVPPPAGSRLWYDDRDIQALAEDKKDLAEVRQLESQQMRSLVDGGFTPESVIDAVTTGDWTRLSHTGLFSVQLQPPQPDGPPEPVVTISQDPPKQLAPPRNVELEGAMRALTAMASREQRVTIEAGAIQATFQPPEINPPDINISAPVTIAEGAVQVTTPEVRVETPITVEPTAVTIAEGAARVEQAVRPAMRTVIDKDATGVITGSHEESV